MEKKYEPLRLCNQLCFPLYAASKEILRRYKPVLDKIDLTYTQYITMMVLWEHGTVSVRDIGRMLYLDSGTLTPVLKKLEQKGFIVRKRDSSDERVLDVSPTEEGMKLRDTALGVPQQIACTIDLSREEAEYLCGILRKLIGWQEQDEE